MSDAVEWTVNAPRSLAAHGGMARLGTIDSVVASRGERHAHLAPPTTCCSDLLRPPWRTNTQQPVTIATETFRCGSAPSETFRCGSAPSETFPCGSAPLETFRCGSAPSETLQYSPAHTEQQHGSAHTKEPHCGSAPSEAALRVALQLRSVGDQLHCSVQHRRRFGLRINDWRRFFNFLNTLYTP